MEQQPSHNPNISQSFKFLSQMLLLCVTLATIAWYATPTQASSVTPDLAYDDDGVSAPRNVQAQHGQLIMPSPLQLINAPLPENAAIKADTLSKTMTQTLALEDGFYAGDRTATARAPLPAGIFDPDNVAWGSNRNYSSSDFAANFITMRDAGYMLIDIEVDEIDGNERVGGVWQYNTDNRGWAEHRNISSTQFGDYWTQYNNMGWRLIDQESYRLNGTRYYAGIWVENSENYAWASNRNLTSQQFSDLFTTYSSSGYIMIDAEAYDWGTNETRYAMAWVENAEGLAWAEHRGMTSAEYSEKFDLYRNTHRVWDVESYQINGSQYYMGIWIENENDRNWVQLRNMTATSFGNYWKYYRDLGFRLVDYEVYEYDSGYRYAAVWRQNGDRYDWDLKSQIDSAITTDQAATGWVGVSAVIAQDGNVLYRRGFGERDAGLWYSSTTVNRLASVSKAIGGVLTMQLAEQGELDIDDNTTAYVSWPFDTPSVHTHTLRELASNRGGFGHYSSYAVTGYWQTAYSSAQIATWSLLSSDPVYTPGTSCIYSTPSYTVLGAALEGATGDSIFDIVQNNITDGLNLPTMQAEFRDEPVDERSNIYDDQGEAYDDPDSLTWKVLGGGLESSAYDLVRYGMKLIDGDIISSASLAEVWEEPTSPCATYDYGLGWDLDTRDGHFTAFKAGGQAGSSTGICIYPDSNLVVGVVANTRTGGAIDLCHDLAGLVLDDAESTPADKSVDAFGVTNTVLGGASAIGTSTSLTLNRLGTTGNGGVSIPVDLAAQWKSTLDFKYAVSGNSQASFLLESSSSNGNAMSRLDITGDETSLTAEVDTRGTGHTLHYMYQGASVAESSSDSIVFDTDDFCTSQLSGGLTSLSCEMDIHYIDYRLNQTVWNIDLSPALWLDTPTGRQWVDQVSFVEGRSSRDLSSSTAELQIRASGMDQIVLSNQVIEQQVPTAVLLGQAGAAMTTTLALPLLVLLTCLTTFALTRRP